MQIPYHKCIVGDKFLFYLGTRKKIAEILSWLNSGKTIVELGHPKNVQDPPSKKQPPTTFFFFYLHTETNMQNPH